MNSKAKYTSDEIVAIRRHLRALVRADNTEQKRIRDRIRDLGFYVDEFKLRPGRFEVSDFDSLLASGTIVEDNQAPPVDLPAPGAIPSAIRDACALRAAAAEKYRPNRVRVLLVAEAPPSAPDRYFYFEKVSTNDWLFRGVHEALFGALPDRTSKAAALAQLRDQGIFLIDLMTTPLDGSRLAGHVPDLVTRCLMLSPERIILIKVTVYDVAYRALRVAGLPVVNRRVSFPSNGRQRDFQRQFAEALAADL